MRHIVESCDVRVPKIALVQCGLLFPIRDISASWKRPTIAGQSSSKATAHAVLSRLQCAFLDCDVTRHKLRLAGSYIYPGLVLKKHQHVNIYARFLTAPFTEQSKLCAKVVCNNNKILPGAMFTAPSDKPATGRHR